jgi:hypothetical protein
MAEISTSTNALPASLDERVARVREQLRSSSRGHKVMQDLSPTGLVKTDHASLDAVTRAIVDFTDWENFSQWPQSW